MTNAGSRRARANAASARRASRERAKRRAAYTAQLKSQHAAELAAETCPGCGEGRLGGVACSRDWHEAQP